MICLSMLDIFVYFLSIYVFFKYSLGVGYNILIMIYFGLEVI